MRIAFALLLAVSSIAASAQKGSDFKKAYIGETGCTVFMPGVAEFDMSYSEDSSEVYTGSVHVDGYEYSCICVRLNESLGTEKEIIEGVSISYLDFLKQALSITDAAGYGKGHTMESNPNAVGVIDYWRDTEGAEYAIKSWADGDYIAVLAIVGPSEDLNFNLQQFFFESFRFPAKN